MQVGKYEPELCKAVFRIYWQFTSYVDDRPRRRVSNELNNLLRTGWRVTTVIGEELSDARR